MKNQLTLKNRTIGLAISSFMPCVLALSFLLLAGCGSLTRSDAPATSTWWLEPLAGNGLSDGVDDDDRTSVLVHVSVVPGLDTANILNLSPNAELSYYTGARWTDELPELLNSLIARSLESDGRYQVVSRRNSRNLDRCILRVEVKAFYAELNQAGNTDEVLISMSGAYRCEGAPGREFHIERRTAVSTNKMSTIVAAFQSGLNASLEQILAQISE